MIPTVAKTKISNKLGRLENEKSNKIDGRSKSRPNLECLKKGVLQ